MGSSGQDMIKKVKHNLSLRRSNRSFKNGGSFFKSSGKKFALRTPTADELRISNEKNKLFIENQRKRQLLIYGTGLFVAALFFFFVCRWLF